MTRAEVRVDDEAVGIIGPGIVVLVGVERGDTQADAQATADKIASLRMFPGATPMDRSLIDTRGAALVISQFTLAASLRKGRRPSFEPTASPELAEPIYQGVVERLRSAGIAVQTGRFGAKMAVELINDGPVTFLVETAGGTLRRAKGDSHDSTR